jgi:BNR repeat-like domain
VRRRRVSFAVIAAVGVLALRLAFSEGALAAVSLTRLNSDPFTNTSAQHRTGVEPDTYAFGSTIAAAMQVGRFSSGGATDIGWAVSKDAGTTWATGLLPLTKYAGGSYDRVSDPAVAYDARHNVWLVSSLVLSETPSLHAVAVVVNRSTNGGLTWSGPVTVAAGGSPDKNWIVCDNHPASAFYGRCYTEWDDSADGNRIKMSTSTNGGASWGVARKTNDNASGLGGQPVVQPNGTVVVPIGSANLGQIRSFRSVDGGASWRVTVLVASVARHAVAGGLRAPALPSAEVDAAGRVYVVWQDCRFRSACAANDIVMSTTTQAGYPTWSSVKRIPIDSTASTVDHFIPGLGVDPATSGSGARLGLTYYYYPSASCSFSTCQLNVGYLSSTNGGSTWSSPTQLAGPMSLSWLASTNQGRMVGDYISTSWSGGSAHPAFAAAAAPTGGLFNESVFTPTTGLR